MPREVLMVSTAVALMVSTAVALCCLQPLEELGFRV